MERCQYEFFLRRTESKHDERTRDEQIALRRVSLARFLMERGEELEALEEPEALGSLVAAHSDRLSVDDFLRLAELLQAKFGPAFVRQSGLPVRTPSLRVA